MREVPNPGYADQGVKRMILRIVGIACMGIALVLIGIAVADFFRAFNANDSNVAPTKFWMFFAALPFFAVGTACLNAGFMGAAARYAAGETMPVAKDSAAYLTDGEGLLGVGRTVDDEPAAPTATGPFCRSCGQRNDAEARFCDRCGQSLA